MNRDLQLFPTSYYGRRVKHFSRQPVSERKGAPRSSREVNTPLARSPVYYDPLKERNGRERCARIASKEKAPSYDVAQIHAGFTNDRTLSKEPSQITPSRRLASCSLPQTPSPREYLALHVDDTQCVVVKLPARMGPERLCTEHSFL